MIVNRRIAIYSKVRDGVNAKEIDPPPFNDEIGTSKALVAICASAKGRKMGGY